MDVLAQLLVVFSITLQSVPFWMLTANSMQQGGARAQQVSSFSHYIWGTPRTPVHVDPALGLEERGLCPTWLLPGFGMERQTDKGKRETRRDAPGLPGSSNRAIPSASPAARQHGRGPLECRTRNRTPGPSRPAYPAYPPAP